MPEWSTFSDKEINTIKKKSNETFDKAAKITWLLSPIICLIAPYLPGRKGRGSMVETMGYEKAVLYFSLFWIGINLFVWFSHKSKTNKEFSENRKFLRRKNVKTVVKRKSRTAFSFFDNILMTELDGNLKTIQIKREESESIKIGEEIQIEYEEQTNTILKLEKVDK